MTQDFFSSGIVDKVGINGIFLPHIFKITTIGFPRLTQNTEISIRKVISIAVGRFVMQFSRQYMLFAKLDLDLRN